MELFAGIINFGGSAQRSLAIAVTCLVLAGCASTSGGGGGGISRLFGGGATSESPDFQPEDFLRPAYCPPVEVRIGTGTLEIFERGQEESEDRNQIRYLASIGRTARECSTPVTGTMAVKLGVSGRVVAGPKGGPGQAALPVRVAVIRQSDNSVLYSELFSVAVSLAAPSFSADYSQVINQVSFPLGPDDRDIVVYVGFDQNAR